MKKHYLSLLFAACLSTAAIGQDIIKPTIKSTNSFAIVIDTETFEYAKSEVIAYQKSVEKDGLGTYIIHKKWNNPDEIRAVLQQLHTDKNQPLEGAVFIGKIPVPMIREAQHLTSTFKMTETLRWDRSSVPSDRFYDDFDLQFEFLKQDEDTKRKNLFYYKLKADSPQYIQMDIYTGRIKPPVTKYGESAETQIKEYLEKLVAVRAEKNPLNHMVTSTGHGYNSNSMTSWAGETMALRTSFPELFQPNNSIKFIHYRSNPFMKKTLLTELKREDLDLAYMTGHGTATLQLLNGYPDASAPQPSMENVALYIRSKMRSAKDAKRNLEDTKANFQKSLGLNDKWFEDAFTPESIAADSLFNENLDIQMHDLQKINARVAYINSCLTGSFHLDNYLAGYYPFSNGKNVVAFSNSIGVLQDLYGIELLGILQEGARTGFLLKKTAYLETHILGDPTYHFTAENNVNALFGSTKTTAKEWEKLLDSPKADLQAYALKELFDLKTEKQFSPKLLNLLKTSPFEAVRTQAYFLLRRYQNSDFKVAQEIALKDNYEYLRRKVLSDFTESGNNETIPQTITAYLDNQESNRLIYKLDWYLQFLDQDLAKKELDKQIEENPAYSADDELYPKLIKKLEYEKKKTGSYKKDLSKTGSTEKEILGEIRTLRAYRYHALVDDVIAIAQDQSQSIKVRTAAIEALSWFGLSYKKAAIITACTKLSTSDKDPLITNAAHKTIAVIKDSSKRPF